MSAFYQLPGRPAAGLYGPQTGKNRKKWPGFSVSARGGCKRAPLLICSGACCMFALKEAIVTKERFQEDIETTIFYMDMRTFGKDYERYYLRARNEFGVRFIRQPPPLDSAVLTGRRTCRCPIPWTTRQTFSQKNLIWSYCLPVSRQADETTALAEKARYCA